jgi:RNA polymerase sigma factor (sigma-70 family)
MVKYDGNVLLIAARIKAGLTPEESAEGIGISYQSYIGFENMRRYPSKKTRERICSFYAKLGINLPEEEVFSEEIMENTPKEYVPKRDLVKPEIIYFSDPNARRLPHPHSMEEGLINANLAETTRKVLASLALREEKILRMRFDIGKNYDRTLEEIGKDFGLDREKIRQIEARALRKLKHPTRARKLKAFLDSKD